jgi:hypothetical protein
LLHKQEGKRAAWEYPFAVAGLNITFMLIQMLDLRAGIEKMMSFEKNSFLVLTRGNFCLEIAMDAF